jgi:phage gp46-like protein
MGKVKDEIEEWLLDESGEVVLDEALVFEASVSSERRILTDLDANISDLILVWDSILLEGDLLFQSNDLVSDHGLKTAALISLFTDRRARDDDELPDSTSTDKRGWWGDLVSPEVEGDEIGSRLWLLSREKTTPETLTRAEQYAKEALQWMIEDGVAASIKVKAERVSSYNATRLDLSVVIRKVDGSVEAMKFDTQWQSMYE